MTPIEYARIHAMLVKVAPKYKLSKQVLDDALQDAYVAYMEHPWDGREDRTTQEGALVVNIAKRHSPSSRDPFQGVTPNSEPRVTPLPDLWGLDDLREALAASIQEAALALGRDYGTGVLAFLQGSKDREEVGHLLAIPIKHRSRVTARRKRRLDLATYRAFVIRLGLVRGRLDISDLRVK